MDFHTLTRYHDKGKIETDYFEFRQPAGFTEQERIYYDSRKNETLRKKQFSHPHDV